MREDPRTRSGAPHRAMSATDESFELRTDSGRASERCRCGTRLSPGAPRLRFARLPPVLAPLLADQPFCGVVCARAHMLEAIELLDARSAATVVQDVPEMLAALRTILGRLPGRAS
jgi:hypothetical protein